MTLPRFLSVAVAALCVSVSPYLHAVPLVYTATLSGPAESPPNASPGTGFGTITYDFTTHIMVVSVSFSGLLAGTTASHIHAPTALPGVGTAGVATQTPTFVGFPLGVTSGTYEHTFDMTQATSWNAAFITANGGTIASAEVVFVNALNAGTSYLNIHTSAFPSGEIRGFLTPSVPDAGTTAGLLGISLLAVAGIARSSRRLR